MSIKWRSYSKLQAEKEESDQNSSNINNSLVVETSHGDPIVRGPGDGARRAFADYREEMSETHKHINYRIETTLYAKEETETTNSFSPPETAHNRRWLYHNGLYSDDQGKREFKDKIAMTQALADELPVTNWEQQRALHIILNLNMLKFNRIGGIEAGILGTLAFVRDLELTKSKTGSGDIEELMSKRIIYLDKYKKLCGNHGVKYHKAIKKVKKIID